jgi:hypothetical protein
MCCELAGFEPIQLHSEYKITNAVHDVTYLCES